MTNMPDVTRTSTGNSGSEDKFIELFCDAFGAEKGQYGIIRKTSEDALKKYFGEEKGTEP